MANILVIDDDTSLCELLVCRLEREGHTARGATSGHEVLEQAEFWSRWADLILTDIFMPEVEGIETLRALKSRGCEVPIVVMSGGAASLDSQHYLACAKLLGASATLLKPFSPEILSATIEAALSGATTHRPLG